jgi:hypothetical protein
MTALSTVAFRGTLSDPDARTSCIDRLARLDPAMKPKWGQMTAPQMVCHLTDAFRVAEGSKSVSPATGFLQRTVVKWVALHTPMKWPKGVPTRPELLQGQGGTPPSRWDADCSLLRERIHAFAALREFGPHPIFGEMTVSEWQIWGYRHVDHHLRQFGV